MQTRRSANQSLGCIPESRLANQRLGCTSVGGEGSDMTAAAGRHACGTHILFTRGIQASLTLLTVLSGKYVSPIINRWRHIRV